MLGDGLISKHIIQSFVINVNKILDVKAAMHELPLCGRAPLPVQRHHTTAGGHSPTIFRPVLYREGVGQSLTEQ